MLSETDKAYLAGLIDGEGSIVIEDCNYRKNVTLRMNITNSHIETLQELKRLYGGCLYIHRSKQLNRYKPVGQLGFTARRAAWILKEICPYLRIKKEQGQLALQFAETITPRLHNGKRLSLEVKEKRRQLREQISKLNKRGPSE